MVLVGSRADEEIAAGILGASTTAPASLVGRTNLKQLAAVLGGARLHLCGDTGSAHIAAALGTRVVSIFGRTDPVKLAPYGQERWVVQHREQCAGACRLYRARTSINRRQKCFAPPPACLEAVTVEEVYETVCRALQAPPDRLPPSTRS